MLSTGDSVQLRGMSALDWDEQRGIITQLWEVRKTTEQIKQHLAKNGLDASIGMLRKRLHQWDLDRKCKEHEMASVARKLRQRSAHGKTSAVIIRGRPINEHEIIRYARRKRLTVDELCRRARSSTPPGIRVRSPSPILIDPPLVYRAPEILFSTLRTWPRPFHAPRYNPWDSEDQKPEDLWPFLGALGELSVSFLSRAITLEFRAATNDFSSLSSCMQKADAVMELVPQSLNKHFPLLLVPVLVNVAILCLANKKEVGYSLLKHLFDFAYSTSQERYGILLRFCSNLGSVLRQECYLETIDAVVKVMVEELELDILKLTGNHLRHNLWKEIFKRQSQRGGRRVPIIYTLLRLFVRQGRETKLLIPRGPFLQVCHMWDFQYDNIKELFY